MSSLESLPIAKFCFARIVFEKSFSRCELVKKPSRWFLASLKTVKNSSVSVLAVALEEKQFCDSSMKNAKAVLFSCLGYWLSLVSGFGLNGL